MNSQPEDFDQAPGDDQPLEQQPEQADVFTRATEALQFGTSEEARANLIEAMRTVAGHEGNLKAIRAEHEATQQYLREIVEQNPHIAGDSLALAAVRQHALEDQMSDLIAAGQLDLDAYRKQFGRDPDPESVSTAHEAMRGGRVPGVKTHVELVDRALDALESRFNIRRRGRGLDESRTQAVDDRISRQATIRGRPIIRRSYETSDSDAPTPIVDATPESVTREYMGQPLAVDNRASNRAEAVARMISDRAHKALKSPDHFLKGR
jgi:hypothetical protein